MVDPLLTALKDRLTAYQPNPVPLNATTLQSAGQSIVDLFTADLGTSALTLTGSASIAFDGDALVVAGPLHSQTLLGLTNPTVTARFTVDNQVLLIDLTIATTTGWALATSFPHLGKDPRLSGLTLDPGHPAAFVLSSVDGPTDAFGPVVSTGLNLRLSVLADGHGALAGFPPVLTLPAGASLTLTGPASITKDDEGFAVRGSCTAPDPKLTIARVPAVTLGKPQAAIDAVATSGSGGWTTTVGLSVYGVTPTPDGSSAALALDIPLGSGPFRLRLASAQPVPFSRLLGFVSGLALLTSIPDAVKSAVTGSLDHWVLGLAGDPGDWRPSSLRLAVSTTDTWTVIPGLVDLRRFQVGLEAAIPASGDPLTTGWVAGDLSLAGGSAELSVTVPLPLDSGDVVVQAMPEYHVAGLGALAALVGGVDLASQLPASVAAIGSFTLTSITVQLNLGTLSVTSIAVSLSADAWTLVPNRLALKQLFIDLAIDTPFSSPALSGVFAGVLLIGTTPVHVLVARGGPGAPWLLEVAVDSVPLPSIGALTELAG
ncbi:MAG: hypothetical protein HOY78_13860, partial [Saccharothrix sp.]|nr:hypothetical protein [Saccharothrix sp.]